MLRTNYFCVYGKTPGSSMLWEKEIYQKYNVNLITLIYNLCSTLCKKEAGLGSKTHNYCRHFSTITKLNFARFYRVFNLTYSLEPRWSYALYSLLPLGTHDEDTQLQKSEIFILAAGLMHSFHYPKVVLMCRDVAKKIGQQNVERETKEQEPFPVWLMAPELERIV